MDDDKISYIDSKVADNAIKKIEDKFVNMMVTGAKEHVFLGMNIKFIYNDRVLILVKDYGEHRCV